MILCMRLLESWPQLQATDRDWKKEKVDEILSEMKTFLRI